MQFPRHSGVFYRIVPTSRSHQAFDPAVSPEGRFHHDNQPALYVSPSPEWARHAIETYVRPGDPPRVIVELHLTARLLDLRDPTHCAALAIDLALAGIPRQPQRAEGQRASTWAVSDRARASGADGMIYTARSEPTRWHVVLFAWPEARLTGETMSYPPARRDEVTDEPSRVPRSSRPEGPRLACRNWARAATPSPAEFAQARTGLRPCPPRRILAA